MDEDKFQHDGWMVQIMEEHHLTQTPDQPCFNSSFDQIDDLILNSYLNNL